MELSLYWALGCDCNKVHLIVMIELHEKGKKKCCSYRDDKVWSELTWDPIKNQTMGLEPYMQSPGPAIWVPKHCQTLYSITHTTWSVLISS